jgi:transposase-like protein
VKIARETMFQGNKKRVGSELYNHAWRPVCIICVKHESDWALVANCRIDNLADIHSECRARLNGAETAGLAHLNHLRARLRSSCRQRDWHYLCHEHNGRRSDRLCFFGVKEPTLWPQIGTSNGIERRFREVRRRTGPMGTFSNRTSMERILYAVFSYENLIEGTITPFLAVTQSS